MRKNKKKAMASESSTASTEEGSDHDTDDYVTLKEISTLKRADVFDDSKAPVKRCGKKAENRQAEKANAKQTKKTKPAKCSHQIEGLEPEQEARISVRQQKKKARPDGNKCGKGHDKMINSFRNDKEHRQQFDA